MPNINGKYLLISKHLITSEKKKKRRNDFTEADFEKQRELARLYAKDRGDDFLIVQVIEEISVPKQESKP
jgi:hypothetical protein